MAPNTTATAGTARDHEHPRSTEEDDDGGGGAKGGDDPYFQNWWSQIVWRNVVYLALLHGVAAYALLTTPVNGAVLTHVWSVFAGLVGGFGVTAGAHRLWTHRAYKAKAPLRIILAICYSMAGENTIFDWVRDHRVHHKFSETNADPHNAMRGFFFAHMGWLMMRKHPDVIRKGRQIDMSDILADPIVAFHTKHFTKLKILFCFILPTIAPHYLWGETWRNSILMSAWRYVLMFNANWLVNSAAHIWGYRPYDKRINPAENIAVSILTLGEGWHNYHHVFPWDYRAAELGSYFLNMTTFYLDMFAKIGWAHDLKCPSQELVERVARRYGDGSHPRWGSHAQEVAEEEDPQKKVLYPTKEYPTEIEENMDHILSDDSPTGAQEENRSGQEAAKTQTSQSKVECSSLLSDSGSEGIPHNQSPVSGIKDPSRKNTVNKYRTGKNSADTVNGTIRPKNPTISPEKVNSPTVAIKNGLPRNYDTTNGAIRGKEANSVHTKPVPSYLVTTNGVARNEIQKKSLKYEACVYSPVKPSKVSQHSADYSDNTDQIKPLLITENKSPYKAIKQQILCSKDMKTVHKKIC